MRGLDRSGAIGGMEGVNPAAQVSVAAARRFMRRALLLDAPVVDTAAALAHLGYVQLDPLNICGRMQDLILRNRVRDYREGDLLRHLHGADPARPPAAEVRVAFEHHLPTTAILVAFPLEAWPHLLAAMDARTRRSSAWSGWLTPRERELAERILAEMAGRGALSSEDIADERRGRRVWGSATLAKTVLQKLFFHGRVLIARRENNRRFYDLPERVLPAAVLAAKVPPATDTARWLALTKLRQRRLALLKRDELPLVEDQVRRVEVAGCPPLYCLRSDEAGLDAAQAADGGRWDAAGEEDVRLLAPLDPLIYDRRVTSALWGFDYVWEAYTPAHKRVRGHYALPVLAGVELVGHAEPKADRKAGRLRLVSKRVRRGHRVSEAIGELATFLGLRR